MIPKPLRLAVYERDSGCCVICGRGVSFDWAEIHHRKYRSRGGRDELANLITLDGCHKTAAHEDSTGLATANGWAVASTKDPADVPVRYADGSLRYLMNLESAA